MLEAPSAILETTAEGVAFVTLNRPEKRNAFDEIMISELSDIFETLRASDKIRIVYLRGAGNNFCSGGDLGWMERAARHDFEDNEKDALELAGMLNKLYHLPQFTVALVQGGAYGGALGLLACCDYVVATENCHFCFSETRIGLIPATIAPYCVRAIGPRYARALFTSAMPFDAHYAHKIGLVHEVALDVSDLAKREERLADLAFCASPSAIAETKDLIELVTDKEIDSALIHETAKRIARRRISIDGQEGLNAFLTKRSPSWANKN